MTNYYKIFTIIAIFLFSSLSKCSTFLESDLNIKEKIFNNILKTLLKQNNKKITNEKKLSLNISDYSINAALFMAQRAIHFDHTFKNDTNNSLPINIDTASLNIIVDELSKYDQNMNMTLRIYENSQAHAVPKIFSDIDGILINLEAGMEFGIFENESEESKILLTFDFPIKLKVLFDTSNNKLSITLNSISAGNIRIVNDILGVDIDKLKLALTNFLKVAVNGLKDDMTNIDILAKINDMSGRNYTKFDTDTNFGYNALSIE
jgi:hypothetical protein